MRSAIAQRLHALRSEIDDELVACGRARGEVTIVGVTKKQPADVLVAAVAAGLRDIGENYVQEAKEKFATVGASTIGLEGARAHFIGHVQTNKAKLVAGLFDLVQTVDRVEAAAALGKAASGAGKVLGVLLQVNISPAERFGCPPGEADRLAGAVRETAGLRLEGMMAIGPITRDPQEIVRAFDLATKTFGRVGGSVLSIGMSSDWREAVRAGSTMVRIGTALFGERRV